jgi:hypothetical protein
MRPFRRAVTMRHILEAGDSNQAGTEVKEDLSGALDSRGDFEADVKRPCVTQICTLRFSDGKSVTARILAASPYEDCVIDYSGPSHRLPVQYERADSVLLRALFQSFARELRAKFREELIGCWEQVAEEEDEAPPAGALGE